MEDHWTVGRVADLAGVSVRTLHHYDEIGLVRPSSRTAAGYRAYSAGDV
ncbi:MerR family transcriptional regulator, partial [Streptomyces sp. MCAF7]